MSPKAPDPADLTRQLVRFDTINPPGQERECARHLAGLLESAGFQVASHEFASGRPSLVARIGGDGGPPLCFAGHIDTVPLGAAPWRHDPFAGEIHEGRLYGRGTTDMKAGVAALVVAALRLAPRLQGTPGLVLVLVAGEETGCEGSRHLARLGALGRAGAIVVAEPTGNYPFVGHKGALWLRATTTGVTAHGSMPEHGVNAVYKAARAVLLLERFEFGVTPHPILGGPTLNVGTISGGLNINSVPDAATASIDIRTIPGQDHRALAATLGQHLGPDVELAPIVDEPGVWTDPGQPWLREVFELMTPYLGHAPEVRGAPYFTDASELAPAYGAPAVILGPGEPSLAHQTDEFCRISRIEEATDIFVEIGKRWCKL